MLHMGRPQAERPKERHRFRRINEKNDETKICIEMKDKRKRENKKKTAELVRHEFEFTGYLLIVWPNVN